MKRPLIIAALAAIGFAGTVSNVALADAHGRDRHNDHGRQEHRHVGPGHHNDRHDRHSHERYRVVRYVPPPGYRHYAWHQGAHLPRAYYASRYVVHDYSAYRLRPPPRGYHWVRVDHDVVLAAVATGLVAQVVSGIFY